MQVPLAERLRPKQLEEVYGQEHLLSKQGIIARSIQSKRPLSLLLWGPPGCGKTTLARLYAQAFDRKLYTLSAVASGVADIRRLIEQIEAAPLLNGTPFILIDEIHRYNRAQQDLLLPYVERGTFLLIGSTTENPSFSLNPALLSRLQVVTLHPLSKEALNAILNRYETQIKQLPLTPEARDYVIELAHGDGRGLLNLIEGLENLSPTEPLTPEQIQASLPRRAPSYDPERHYDYISALHKAVRGSDVDGALYWLARQLNAGEDPLFIARRIIRMASEDIGLADPTALQQAIVAKDAYEMLGSPEGELALAQAIVYLAMAPKSNALYTAFGQAKSSAEASSHLPPPRFSLNAPTRFMKKEGYGKGYIYDHDTPSGYSGQNYFPDELERQEFYEPVDRGFERELRKRLEFFRKHRKS